ncbi:MAG: zinc ABC transporter substrate-binding protein [Pseudonocardiales bacterium]|nr:zinc ABC transporter substrate-binding protein [Pseudonocardiales bacterium]
MILRRPLVGATAALAALTLTACGSEAAAPATADDGITVVASTNVYGSIAEAVGGPGVTVESLITDPAADPHSYESTPADAVTVGEGDIVILNGGGYDEFMPQLVETAGGERTVLDVAAISGLVPEEEGEEAHAEGEEHAHGEFNEHFWYSLPTVRTLATDLAAALGELDAANAATYTANAGQFTARIDELMARIEAAGASVPGGRVAVTEPVPGYLIEAAGLTDVTPPEFSEAVEEDTDPPAAVVADTLALFTPGAADPVRALITNAQTETPTTDQVRGAAEAAGVPVVEMTETLPADETDYVSWMGSQIEALTAALNPV